MAALVVLLIIVGSTAGYLLPSIIAFRNAHEHRWLILLANIFGGWTGVGWFPLLLWACRVFGGPGIAPSDFQVAAMRRVEPTFDQPPAAGPVRRANAPLPASASSNRNEPLRIRPRANW
jgi:hypothetical protein